MCWNEHVSMNTFLFSSFVLGLVLYNNLYTPYKIKEIHSLAAYLFLLSIVFMQLVEFFLWRNLTNDYNLVWSGIGLGLLLLQPIFSLSLITEVGLREWLAVVYVFWVLVLGKLTVEKTVVGENGQLEWGFFKWYSLFVFGWFVFLFIGPIYAELWVEIALALVLGMITFIRYQLPETRGSVWCWFVNILLVYYAWLILFWYPFVR